MSASRSENDAHCQPEEIGSRALSLAAECLRSNGWVVEHASLLCDANQIASAGNGVTMPDESPDK